MQFFCYSFNGIIDSGHCVCCCKKDQREGDEREQKDNRNRNRCFGIEFCNTVFLLFELFWTFLFVLNCSVVVFVWKGS